MGVIERELPDSAREWGSLLLAVLVGLATVAFAPFATDQALLLGITLFCIVLWITTPVPPWFTGLAGIAMIGIALSPELAMGGFAEPVLWLIVFGLVVGEAIHRGGLTGMVERRLLGWLTPEEESVEPDPVRLYRRLLVVLSFGGLAFAAMVPSSLVRVLIMAPILIQVGKIFKDRRPRMGLLFGPLFATFYGGLGMLTAVLPNIVTTGILESVTGTSISWAAWFLTMFPVMGLGRVVVIIAVVYWLYRPSEETAVRLAPVRPGPAGDALWHTTAILLVGVAFWATDSIHGLHPVFGALFVAMLFMMPGIGIVSFETIEDVDFSIVFFVGAVFAISDGLTETGFTEVATSRLLALIPQDTSLVVVLLAIFVVTMGLMLLIEGLAAASVLTPILISFALEAGIPVETMIQIEAMALGHLFFPYQSMVLVAMLSIEPIEMRELIRVTALLTIATLVLLLPLQLGIFVYL